MGKEKKSIEETLTKTFYRHEKKDWIVDLRIEGGTEEQIDRIAEKFIDAVRDEGLFCGGGITSVTKLEEDKQRKSLSTSCAGRQ